MPGFVLHHVCIDSARQRILPDVADQAERRQRQPLDEHLHAQIGEIPARVGYDIVEQRLQILIDRVCELELLVQETRIRLDVPRLVDHLCRRVKLAVHIGHGLHDLRCADERALLTMQELRELPRRGVMHEFAAIAFAHLLPRR